MNGQMMGGPMGYGGAPPGFPSAAPPPSLGFGQPAAPEGPQVSMPPLGGWTAAGGPPAPAPAPATAPSPAVPAPATAPATAPAATPAADATLPPGWHACVDASNGLPYYFNTATQQSQWEHPGGSSAAARAPMPAASVLISGGVDASQLAAMCGLPGRQ